MPDCVNHDRCGAQGTRVVGPRDVACAECAPKILAERREAGIARTMPPIPVHLLPFYKGGDETGKSTSEFAMDSEPFSRETGNAHEGSRAREAVGDEDRRAGSALRRVLAAMPSGRDVAVYRYEDRASAQTRVVAVAWVGDVDDDGIGKDAPTLIDALEHLAAKLEGGKP